MAVCYKDLEFLKKNFLRKPTARFCGLGGEFIRHPCKNYYRSLFYGFEKGLYSRLSIDVACKIVNQNINKYKEMLKNYFDSYPEKMPEDQLKRFYYEYYNHYVDWGGEERGRLYFWTVEPLWGLNFVRPIFNQLPLSWTGYRYYVQFLKSLNPLLLKVPIYDSRINLESMFGLYFYDFFEKLKKSNFAIIFRRKIQSRIPSLMIPYYKRKYKKTTVGRFDRNYLFKKSQYYYEALKHTKNIFNFNIIKRKLFKPDDDTERVLTLMIYFKEIEKRFGNKFSNSN
jgi:hypothetical protein